MNKSTRPEIPKADYLSFLGSAPIIPCCTTDHGTPIGIQVYSFSKVVREAIKIGSAPHRAVQMDSNETYTN